MNVSIQSITRVILRHSLGTKRDNSSGSSRFRRWYHWMTTRFKKFYFKIYATQNTIFEIVCHIKINLNNNKFTCMNLTGIRKCTPLLPRIA